MPTYDYSCEACGPFEEWQSIKADPLKVCPKCGGSVKKLISKNINVIFKGSGWYCTDSRPQPAKESEAEKPSSTASAADASTAPAKTPSESKDVPATKTP